MHLCLHPEVCLSCLVTTTTTKEEEEVKKRNLQRTARAAYPLKLFSSIQQQQRLWEGTAAAAVVGLRCEQC